MILEIIHTEHGYINRLLKVLQQKLESIKNGQSVDYSLIKDIVDYLHNYAQCCHHPKEDILYHYYQSHYAKNDDMKSLEQEHQELAQLTSEFAETVDIYPTLAELAGLPAPQVPQGLDGTSLVPVLEDPSASVRNHAYHSFPRRLRIGRAIRTDRYRLVEWKIPGKPESTAQYELYDYETDALEKKNLAETHPEVLERMKAILATHPEAKPNQLKK